MVCCVMLYCNELVYVTLYVLLEGQQFVLATQQAMCLMVRTDCMTNACLAYNVPEVSDVQLIDGRVSPRGSREGRVRSPALWHCHVIIHRNDLQTTVALSGIADNNKVNGG